MISEGILFKTLGSVLDCIFSTNYQKQFSILKFTSRTMAEILRIGGDCRTDAVLSYQATVKKQELKNFSNRKIPCKAEWIHFDIIRMKVKFNT